ncbi:hypothetical protein BaRGS_00012168 [Batillaria attramentaria]|uniref:Uncharacterized protein n=1 Tax=Batillaria attramentaria TaxID=370345 RepID=A0ABD0LB93_9CAEN
MRQQTAPVTATPQFQFQGCHHQAVRHPRYSLRSTVQAGAGPEKDEETSEVSNNRIVHIKRVVQLFNIAIEEHINVTPTDDNYPHFSIGSENGELPASSA